MSQESINKSLQNTLLSPLTHDSFWSQFLNSISYEMKNVNDSYSSIKNNWNIYNNDKNNLIRISESFGYTPNLTIDNTVDMAKREIESIPYRIREKTTYNGYSLIFQQNDSLGETFNYYWNGKKLVKAIDYKSTSVFLFNSNHYSPFFKIIPNKNYSSSINSDMMILDYLENGEKKIDEGTGLRIFSLDLTIGSSVWKLDTPYVQIPTKHLGIEYFPQHYYCTYFTSLGITDESVLTYECQIQFLENYIPNSMKININGITLDTTTETIDNKEYFINEDGVLESNSYFDITNNLVHLEFTDIPSNYEISVSYNINLLINSDYFHYLEQGVEYNRRCPIIPHTGVFLSADIAPSRGSDFYYPNEENYTIPDLKIKAITSSSYNRKIILTTLSKLDNAFNSEGNPSGEENYKLDSTIKWFLDSDSSQATSLINNIKYIACGNKALNIINEAYNQIFNQGYISFYYNLNSDDYSHEITDLSSNNIDCDVVGSDIKIDSIISKSLNFNGETYAHSQSSLNINTSLKYTMGLWFKANSEGQNLGTIFDSFVNISYNYENKKIKIGSLFFDCSENDYHFVCLLFKQDKILIYLDNQFLGEFEFIIDVTSSEIYLGVDSSIDNYFYGELDNIWLMNKELTTDEISYIYENKISLISHMGNRLSYYELYDDEKYEDDNYNIIQSYIKSMDISNEITMLDNTSESIHTYSYKTRFYPISPSYFSMSYTDSLANTVTIQSNKNGDFYNKDTGKIITGNIDFKNGVWNLAKSTIKSVSQKPIVVISESPYTELHETLYKVYDYINDSSHYYETYNIKTEEHSDEIIADDYNLQNLESTTLIDTADDDTSSSKEKLYSSDGGESFSIYMLSGNLSSPIKVFNVVSDETETPLFTKDNGSSLYSNLEDLKKGQNQLKSYVDLGEASSTPLFSKDGENISHLYLDVQCSENKQVRKYKVTTNDSEVIGYTLGNDTSIVYTDLKFTSIIPNISSKEDEEFNLMQLYIKSIQNELKVSPNKTIYEYKNSYSTNYIKRFEKDIDDDKSSSIVKNSITFTYWVGDTLEKTIARVNEEGGVIGENINSGNFDYTTNILTVEFNNKIKSDVVVSYEYYDSLDIDYTKPIIMNYKTKNSIKINEIGLEDENHELMAYMTFPDVEFNTIYDNLSALFAISKSS